MGLFKDKIKEQPITSLEELIKDVKPTAPDPGSGRYRDYSIYRGLSDVGYDLLTSLDRLGGTSPFTKNHLEPKILLNFERYSHPHLPSYANNEWERLVIAQHHGLPTRLLDWTYSPLVAAHFATLNCKKKYTCVIWKLDWHKLHEYFDLDIASAPLKLDDIIRKKGYKDLSDLINPSKDTKKKDFICIVEPHHLSPRITAQSSLFTISSFKNKPLNEIIVNQGLTSIIKKYVIDFDNALIIRDQLDSCFVDERHLFPDLDGIAEHLTRHFST